MKARRILSCTAAAATGLMSSAALTLSAAGPARAQLAVAQDKVVGSVPASFTPNIDGGAVLALAQAGSWIVAGRSFTSATPHGSSTAVPDSGIVAFDQGTGALDAGFKPTLDGQVDAVIPGPTAGTVYVGGQFSTVNGVKSKGITLLNLSDGSNVAGFKPPALNGIVEAMRLAGTFTLAGGVTHDGLATLNPATGALTTFMNVQLTGHHNYTGTGANGPVGGRAMDISPDGTRAVVVGNFKDANGAVHDQVVMLDLTGASAAIDPDWNTGEFTGACASNAFDSYVEDVSFAPDGSYFAIATTGGGGISSNTDGSRSLCDSASRWATTDTGSNVQPTWVDYTGNDSFWTVAVTGTAIYVGGQEFTAAGGNFANVAGEFLSGSTLYYASRSDGTLHSVSFSNGGTNGASPSVDASTDATVSGPAIDGNDWRSRGLFAFGGPTFPDQPPTAQATASCTNLTCSFDGTGSTDPDGTVASYAWDFGDGSAGTGATPSHGYATAGTYTYRLTVTDNDGVASAPAQGTVVATGAGNPIAFAGAADGYSKSGTSVSVTTPAAVSQGDTEPLYVTTANADSNGAVATGTYPAQTASVGGTASGKGAMISLVLAPPS